MTKRKVKKPLHTVISLDSWQIKTFLTCEESFKLSYIENLKKTSYFETTQNHRYLDKGTLVHLILGIYYTLRALDPKTNLLIHGKETLTLVRKSKMILESGFDKDFESFLLERLLQYFILVSQTKDFIPLHVNGVVGVEVPFAIKIYEDYYKTYILEGRIDLLGSYGDIKERFIDHKTQDRVTHLYERKIQFLCYALATGFEYGMVNYFGLQKSLKNDSKEGSFRQELIYIPKSYIEVFKKYLISNVFWPLWNRIKFNSFNKNLNSCSGVYDTQPCPYSMICEEENDLTRQSLIKKIYFEEVKPWSPWTPWT